MLRPLIEVTVTNIDDDEAVIKMAMDVFDKGFTPIIKQLRVVADDGYELCSCHEGGQHPIERA